MKKCKIAALKQKQHVMNEKRILEEMEHPFIIDLIATYKDSVCLCAPAQVRVAALVTLCHLAAFVQSVKKNSGCSLSACTPPLVSKLLLTSARSLAQRVIVSM